MLPIFSANYLGVSLFPRLIYYTGNGGSTRSMYCMSTKATPPPLSRPAQLAGVLLDSFRELREEITPRFRIRVRTFFPVLLH